MGLCYKCGAKWSKDHRCSPDVLHAVQDLWECLSYHSDDRPEQPTPQEHLCLAISKAAVSGAPAPRTIQLLGTIQGLPITILTDSGSTSSFVSTTIVQQLSSQTIISQPSSVSIAGGGLLHSAGILQHAALFIDDYSFTANLKVLPLVHFDVILGMDWLEEHSPMHVHWKYKWLQFQSGDSHITLQGLSPSCSDTLLLQVCFAIPESDGTQLSAMPKELQSLLQQFQHLFDPPVGLPPPRACNHVIPLLPGSKPVAVRPYRYPPKLKDELEKQVVDMLQQGII